MRTINRIKFLFLLLIVANLSTFALADTECISKDCSIGVSINVVDSFAAFNGSVRDLTGGLITNVNVTVLGTGDSTVSTTGTYNMAVTISGLQDLTASADGYLSQTKTNQLAVTGVTTTVDFTLGQTGRITGNILDFFTGNGINNANVTLILYGDILSSTLTDANGYYEFISLESGYYDINVEATGFNSNSKSNNHVLVGENTTVNFWMW